MNITLPRYDRSHESEFGRVLRKRVNDYFESKNISRTGDYRMAIKAVFMFSLYFVPYGMTIAMELTTWQYLFAYVFMGFGLAGIGLAIMHDANHGSLSSRPWLNKLLGHSLDAVGGNALAWKIQHNVLHHSFTNVSGLDEDLEAGHIMRFTPNEPWKKHHRFQQYYAWVLYSFMTFSWVLVKDFRRLVGYDKRGLIKDQGTSLAAALTVLTITKIVYLGYIFALPIYMGYSVGLVLGGFAVMHLIGGLLLAAIFQPAHVMEQHDFVPQGTEVLNKSYETHQLSTTTNFAAEDPILTWYCGGLNFQIEHHIFPSICHVHYPEIAKIVKATAAEFGLPYRSIPTFAGALGVHQRTLKALSVPEWKPSLV